MKNRIISGTGAVIAGLLVAIGPHTVFKVCEAMHDGGFMKCHWTAQAELGIGLLIAALGVFLLLSSSAQTRLGLSAAAALAGVLVILFPAVIIGGCGMSTMECQTTAFPALYLLGALIVVGFTFNAIYLLLTSRQRNEVKI